MLLRKDKFKVALCKTVFLSPNKTSLQMHLTLAFKHN